MGAVFVLVKYYIFIPNLMQQIGVVEWQLASDTYTGKAGVICPMFWQQNSLMLNTSYADLLSLHADHPIRL